LINTSQQIGGAIGLAVLSTIATTRTDDVLASGTSSLPNALTDGFQAAFLGGAAIAALGFVATLVLIRNRDSRAHSEMANAQAAPASVCPPTRSKGRTYEDHARYSCRRPSRRPERQGRCPRSPRIRRRARRLLHRLRPPARGDRARRRFIRRLPRDR